MKGSGIVVAVASHLKDKTLSVQLMKWICALGCCHNRELLIVLEQGHETAMEPLQTLARSAFGKVEVLSVSHCPWGNAWPMPPNWVFCRAAEKLAGRAFLWMEPDSFPTKQGWMDEIEQEYLSCGKAYMGTVFENSDPKLPKQMMHGVGVYPTNAFEQLGATIANGYHTAFDMYCATKIVPQAHKSDKFQHFMRTPEGPLKLTRLDVVNDSTRVFHGDKFGNLCRMLLLRKVNGATQASVSTSAPAEPTTTQKTVAPVELSVLLNAHPRRANDVGFHSGDIGDIIYCLPVCRALGITKLFLVPGSLTRTRMTRETAAAVAPLVEAQSYMESCKYADAAPRGAIDLNGFRNLLAPGICEQFHYHNLSALQLRWFGLSEHLETEQWLWATPVLGEKRVVFARSPRYHSTIFDWKAVYAKYGKDAMFVGLPDEHRAFEAEVGKVPYRPTSNLLEVAQLIAGSDLFVGNQSSPFAIAEGLKHPSVLEWTNGPAQNCHFSRPGLVYGTHRTKLPEVGTRPKLDWVTLSDLHSGFGRMAHALYRRSRALELHWVPTRIGEDFTPMDRAVPLVFKRSNKLAVVLESVPVIGRYIVDGDIGCTMWESSRLPKRVARELNRCRSVIVPSEWCRHVFLDSGVTKPIAKVPLGVDSSLYIPPKIRVPNKIMTFGASARFCGDGNPRKNLDRVIEAFKIAFPGRQDVRLEIKGYDSTRQVTSDDPRIKVIVDFWSEREMVKWYQGLDCFINVPRGGGWELHVHEAMLCGAVPIVLGYSSTTEFVDANCGFIVDHKLIQATWHVYRRCGLWAVPVMDSFVSVLRHAESHRDQVELRRPRARRAVEHLTWDHAAALFDRAVLNML